MDAFQVQLNTLLKEIYWNIQKVQEDFVRRVGCADITMSEMHILEVIGDASAETRSADETPHGLRISDIAAALNVTLPTVTVAIKKLAGKQCVKKVRCKEDGRQVDVIMTELGEEIYHRHERFHQRMVGEIAHCLSPEETAVMLKAFENINVFFRAKLMQETK